MQNNVESKTVENQLEATTTEAQQMTDVMAAKEGALDLGLQPVELQNLPSLENAQEIPIDLIDKYWTPNEVGEKKRVYFHQIEVRETPDMNNPEVLVPTRFAMFIEVEKNGTKRFICSAAAKLTGFLSDRSIVPLTPLQITYKGKAKNKSNGFSHDDFEIKLLTPVNNG